MMKTIFDTAIRQSLIQRIRLITVDSQRAWGKMTVYQMARHCTIWNEWVLGIDGFVYKQEFLGKIFGPMALKSNTRDDKPISMNMPAGNAFTVQEKEGDLPSQLFLWSEQIAAYEKFSNPQFVHDFFGKMTPDEIGIFAFKHNDHHLRQFNH